MSAATGEVSPDPVLHMRGEGIGMPGKNKKKKHKERKVPCHERRILQAARPGSSGPRGQGRPIHQAAPTGSGRALRWPEDTHYGFTVRVGSHSKSAERPCRKFRLGFYVRSVT